MIKKREHSVSDDSKMEDRNTDETGRFDWDRRRWLKSASAVGCAALTGTCGSLLASPPVSPFADFTVADLQQRFANGSERRGFEHETLIAPTHSIEPVVGDGKWISKKPPSDPVGNYEPRLFDLSIGLEINGTGNTTDFVGTTVAPVQSPEQEILSLKIEKRGCEASLQKLSESAARLVVSAGSLARGDRLSAAAQYRVRLHKTYHGFSPETLSATTLFPGRIYGQWLGNSPGIQTHSREVRDLAKQLSSGNEHPFEWAKSFQSWVFDNIRGRPMKYTSVTKAIRNRVGDCEERAGVFIALCRASGIPARLVWVPNHAWAEFCLYDSDNRPRWIPAHTAAYNWLGWTGAHELVLQKGDRIELPNSGKKVRLVADWMRWKGEKPDVRFRAFLQPATEDQTDAGPGTRDKNRRGQWCLNGKHPDEKYLRR